ncbi:MAG: hypothetical protein ACD_20C00214G0011 [uncultured bacterium]|nr:MAG: hypothetical protein ACD_20C00214G0011 [uncultured bacterium]HBH17469.1 hypothetical protein [Cyanobacteria bacterium UBA9579]
MKKLVVYGTVYPDIVKLIDSINRVNPEWELIGFIDDNEQKQGKEILGIPVLGGREIIPELTKDENLYFFNNYFGSVSDFKRRIALLESYGCKIPTLIHPAVDIVHSSIGRGCIIEEGCNIGTRVTIGNFVTIHPRCVISHDVKIEDYALIAPGCTVGSCLHIRMGSFIGGGATILRTKNLGRNSVVGAGAVVVNDVPDGITVVGVPAKKMKKNLFRRLMRRLSRDIRRIKQSWLVKNQTVS